MGKWHRHRSLSKRWNRNQLVNKFGNVCGVCHKPIIKMHDITIDHVIPLARGGADDITNLQLAHYECNQEKDCMLPAEFEAFQRGEVYVRQPA